MNRFHSLAPLALVLLAACGPGVGETRMASASPRPPDCDLDFLELKMEDMAPGGRYEVLGYVTLAEQGTQDPLQPGYRDIVRPRACAMGGEAVAVPLSGTVAPSAFGMGSTSVAYAVLRKRQAHAAARPSKF